MLNTHRLIKAIKEIEKLYCDIEPLIEGLPFNGPPKMDESSLHYFQQAAHTCVELEQFFVNLSEHLEERARAIDTLLNQVVEWDIEAEGVPLCERLQVRREYRVVRHLVAKQKPPK